MLFMEAQAAYLLKMAQMDVNRCKLVNVLNCASGEIF